MIGFDAINNGMEKPNTLTDVADDACLLDLYAVIVLLLVMDDGINASITGVSGALYSTWFDMLGDGDSTVSISDPIII